MADGPTKIRRLELDDIPRLADLVWDGWRAGMLKSPSLNDPENQRILSERLGVDNLHVVQSAAEFERGMERLPQYWDLERVRPSAAWEEFQREAAAELERTRERALEGGFEVDEQQPPSIPLFIGRHLQTERSEALRPPGAIGPFGPARGQLAIPETALGKAGLSFGAGLGEVMHALPFVGESLVSTDAIMRAREAAATIKEEHPVMGRVAQAGGHLLPIITAAGPMAQALRAAGLGPTAASVATGGTIGALTTEGGLGSRAKGAALGGLSFGAATRAGLALRPFISRVQNHPLVLGGVVEPNIARRVAARFADHAIMSQADVAAFMGVGLLERAAMQQPLGLGEMYVDNLIAVGLARASHARLPSEFAMPGRAREARRQIVEGFEREPGLLGKARAAKDMIRTGYDTVDVLSAYRAALKGFALTPQQARIMVQLPTAQTRALAPRGLEDLAQDTPEAIARDVAARNERIAELNRVAESARADEIAAARARLEPKAQALDARAEKVRTAAAARAERPGSRAAALLERADKVASEAQRNVERRRLAADEAAAQKSFEEVAAEGGKVRSPAERIRDGVELTAGERKVVEATTREIAEEVAARTVRPPSENPRAQELRVEAETLRAEIAENGPANQILKRPHRFPVDDLLAESPIQPSRRPNAAEPWTLNEKLQALREAGVAPKFIDKKRRTGAEPGATPLDQAVSGMGPGQVFEQVVRLSQPGRKNLGQIRGQIKRLEKEARRHEKEASKEYEAELNEARELAMPEAEKRARAELAMEYERARIEENPRLMGGVEFDPMLFEPPTEAARDLYRARQRETAKPSDPKLAEKLRAEALEIVNRSDREVRDLRRRAQRERVAARKIMRAAEPKARRAEKRAASMREFVPVELRDLEKLADVSIGMMPRTSRAMRVAESGTLPELSAMLDRLKASNGIPHPLTEMRASEVVTPEGLATVWRDLGRLPPSNPGVARSRYYSAVADMGIRPRSPMPWDWVRQSAQTNFKMLPEPYARTLQSLMLQADFKSSRFRELFRNMLVGDAPILRADGIYQRWNRWVKTLSPELQRQALDRVVQLDRTGNTVGTAPVETQFLQTLRRLFGRVEQQMRGAGVKTREGGFFPFVRETILVGGPAAERALAREMFGGPIGGERRGSTGSRHFKRRVSSRDFVLDSADQVGQILDVYINSTQRAIHWKPVRQYVDKVLTPRVFGERGVLSQRAIESARKDGTLAQLKNLHADSRRVKSTRKFLDGMIDDAAAKRSSILDVVDMNVSFAMDNLAARSPKPIARVLRSRAAQAPITTLVKGGVAGIYLGGLALNAGSAIKNLTQFWANTLPQVGVKHSLKAALWDTWVIEKNYKTGRRRIRLHPQIAASGVLSGRFSRNVMGAQSIGNRVGAALKSIGDLSLFMFSMAEAFNRAATFRAGYLRAKADGMSDAKARETARLLVSRTQFDYLPGVSGRAFRNPLAHPLFQFQRFPLYQMDYMQSVAREAIAGRSTLFPDGDPLAPAFRTAISIASMNAILSWLGFDLRDAFGIAGMPEPVKVVATGFAQDVGQDIAERQGRPGLEGRIEGTQFMRDLGLAPFSPSLLESLPRSFGPIFQMGTNVADLYWGTPEAKANARKEFARTFTIAMPMGLAMDRIQRYMQESEELKVLNTRTGEVMFPIDRLDVLARLVGVNSENVGESYEQARDEKYRDSFYRSSRRELLDDSRLFFQKLRNQGDPDAAAKTAARYLRGVFEIQEMTGMMAEESAEDIKKTLIESVFMRVIHGERSTEMQRIRERNRALRRRSLEQQDADR